MSDTITLKTQKYLTLLKLTFLTKKYFPKI